jgi:hypothetical protein
LVAQCLALQLAIQAADAAGSPGASNLQKQYAANDF